MIKIRIIHNALSFHSFYDLANYNHKKKEVLISDWKKNKEFLFKDLEGN